MLLPITIITINNINTISMITISITITIIIHNKGNIFHIIIISIVITINANDTNIIRPIIVYYLILILLFCRHYSTVLMRAGAECQLMGVLIISTFTYRVKEAESAAEVPGVFLKCGRRRPAGAAVDTSWDSTWNARRALSRPCAMRLEGGRGLHPHFHGLEGSCSCC